MLSKEENDLLTNSNPGSPMGELFRRFWLPAALSEELPGPDCEPLRVKLLNENLIAFRDTEGKVGLIDAYCPHRGAPMFFGRNEEEGLRCIYHGWKFDTNGSCVDMPNAPEGEAFRHKIQIKHYPTVEAGDLIWAYLGPKDKQPPFPEFEWTKLPKENRYVTKFVMECNYLQAMEGDYDPSHVPFLHTKIDGNFQDPDLPGVIRPKVRPTPENEPFQRAVGPRRQTEADKFAWGRIEDTNSGVFFISASERADGTKMASVAPWMMPIFCTAGTSASPNTMSANLRVPIDNERIYFYRLRWSYTPIPDDEIRLYESGGWYYPEMISGTWTPKHSVHNDYNIDRQLQKGFIYSGMTSFTLQDVSMMENQRGPLVDRTKEHLTTSDFQIIYVRRRLLRTVEALAASVEPSEPWHPEAYAYRRATIMTREGTLDDVIATAKSLAVGRQASRATSPELPV